MSDVLANRQEQPCRPPNANRLNSPGFCRITWKVRFSAIFRMPRFCR